MTLPKPIRYLLAPQMVPFVLRALVLVALLTWMTQTAAFESGIKIPLMCANAWLTHKTLALFGTETYLQDRFVYGENFNIEIVEACTGLFVFVLLFSATIAFPSAWKSKGLGVLFGAAMIFVLNWARIISLFYLGSWKREWFDDAHLYVWQGVTIACVTIYWYAWAVRTVPADQPSEAPAS